MLLKVASWSLGTARATTVCRNPKIPSALYRINAGVSKIHNASFSAFARSIPAEDTVTVQVPTMGDSITEGTIVEWSVPIGGAVSEGDVIALVETDKVTVDIKADVGGVITKQYGELEDTIEVGANLYDIDTEAEGIVDLKSSSEILASKTANDSSASLDSSHTSNTTENSVPNLPPATGARIPSIQFLGKKGWEIRRNCLVVVDEGAPSEPVSEINISAVTSASLSQISNGWNPMTGRPPISDEEIEALAMGGASVAPTIKRSSIRAVFNP